MTDYRLLTGRVPNQNWSDENIARLLGLHFTVTEPGYDLTELSYLVPVQGLGELTTALVQLWDITHGVKVAEVDLKALPAGGPETWMRVPIPRYTPNLADTYFAGCFTVGNPGHYTFNTTNLFPIISGPLHATVSGFRDGGTPHQPPTGTYNGFYLVDVTASPSLIPGTINAGLATVAPGFQAVGALSTPATLTVVAGAPAAAVTGAVFTAGTITGSLTATAPVPWSAFGDAPPAGASDVESVLLAWLRAHPDLSGFHFGTQRPAALTGRLPYVMLTRTGGTAATPTWRGGPVIDRPAIALQVWASPDQHAARQACAVVLFALVHLRNVVAAGLTVSRVVPVAGLSVVPDPHAPAGIHRTTASVRITTR